MGRSLKLMFNDHIKSIYSKYFIILIYVLNVVVAYPKTPFLKEVSFSQMEAISNGKEGVFFAVIGQYLQDRNGQFSDETGKVLIKKQGNRFLIAFYRIQDGKFHLIDDFVEFTDTHPPFAGAINNLDVPCIQAIEKNSGKNVFAYVLKGKVTKQ